MSRDAHCPGYPQTLRFGIVGQGMGPTEMNPGESWLQYVSLTSGQSTKTVTLFSTLEPKASQPLFGKRPGTVGIGFRFPLKWLGPPGPKLLQFVLEFRPKISLQSRIFSRQAIRHFATRNAICLRSPASGEFPSLHRRSFLASGGCRFQRASSPVWGHPRRL